ncbi:MAG: shikimate dehydrogenase, partial [Pseudomonadota bacterium]
HSKSPKLHGHWIAKHSAHGLYTAIETPPGAFPQTVQILKKMGFAGVNVTLPHKEIALHRADTATDTARSIGAANTLRFLSTGDIHADNTDAYGFIENLYQSAPQWDPTQGPALVLGAGGAARAVLYALLQAKVPHIYLANRTADKAQTLADFFGDMVTVIPWNDRAKAPQPIHTLVNTTSLGMTGHADLHMDLRGLADHALVTDIVYTPLKTELLHNAEQQGYTTVDGLGMLLHQAIPGSKAWFGTDPIVDDDLRQIVLE